MQNVDVTLFIICNNQILKGSKILPCALGGKLKVYIGEYPFQTSSWYLDIKCEYWDPEMLSLDFGTGGTLQDDVTAWGTRVTPGLFRWNANKIVSVRPPHCPMEMKSRQCGALSEFKEEEEG